MHKNSHYLVGFRVHQNAVVFNETWMACEFRESSNLVLDLDPVQDSTMALVGKPALLGDRRSERAFPKETRVNLTYVLVCMSCREAMRQMT